MHKHIFFVTSELIAIVINSCEKEYRVRKNPKAYQNYTSQF